MARLSNVECHGSFFKMVSGVTGEPCSHRRAFLWQHLLPSSSFPMLYSVQPLLLPLYVPGLAISKDSLVPFPLSGSHHCCRRVADMSQACCRRVINTAISTWLPMLHRSGGEWPGLPPRRV